MSDIDNHILEATTRIASMGRRDFLKFSSIAAGLAAAVGTGLISPRAAFASMPEGIKVMSESDYAVFHRLMEVMLPVAGTPLTPLDKIPVMQTLDAALLATMEPHILQGLKGGVKYFNEGPLPMFKKHFVDLSDAEAIRFCDTWANSNEIPQRGLAMGLKKLVGLAYWANPPTWPPLGYDGPVTDKWGLKYQGNAPMPKR